MPIRRIHLNILLRGAYFPHPNDKVVCFVVVCLVVQTTVLNKKVRFINGYGHKEDETEKSKSFFSKLDEEIKSAKLAGDLICIELDANSKLGPSVVPVDPKPQSKNGKMLLNVVDENGLD